MRKCFFLKVYDIFGSSKNSDFPKENQWFLRFRRFRYRTVFVSYFPRLGPPRRPQKPFKRSPKSSSEEYQMKLRLERAFKIASKIDFGSKSIPRLPPNRLQNRFQSGLPLGSPSHTIFWGCKRLLSSILDNFGIDLGPPWEWFWTLKWCQIH